jgi:hypothetical protein
MNTVDKIVLSRDKCKCVVHFVNGTTLFFNFFKMRMTYLEFLEWFDGVTHVGIQKEAS